ncbi:unnamed protein product, partial [Scytosiphon promiscuus]
AITTTQFPPARGRWAGAAAAAAIPSRTTSTTSRGASLYLAGKIHAIGTDTEAAAESGAGGSIIWSGFIRARAVPLRPAQGAGSICFDVRPHRTGGGVQEIGLARSRRREETVTVMSYKRCRG